MDSEVARHVLGRPLGGFGPRAATLKGYRRVYVAGASYPGLIADADASVEGVLVFRVPALEASRVSRYEGPQYSIETVSVSTESGTEEAQIFLPKDTVRLSEKPWRLNDWCRNDKRRFMSGLRRNELV